MSVWRMPFQLLSLVVHSASTAWCTNTVDEDWINLSEDGQRAATESANLMTIEAQGI